MLSATGKWVSGLAKLVAIVGGIVLVAVSIMTCVSIIGRSFLWAGLKPVKGDFEMVEAGIAFAVAAFMPWCQLERGHASVGIFIDNLGPRVDSIVHFITDLLLFGTACFLTWRHIYGMLDKQAYMETTFILQYPVWWAYAIMLVGLVAWVLVGAWCTVSSAVAIKTGRQRGIETGVVH